jgi:hypothetical protein
MASKQIPNGDQGWKVCDDLAIGIYDRGWSSRIAVVPVTSEDISQRLVSRRRSPPTALCLPATKPNSLADRKLKD